MKLGKMSSFEILLVSSPQLLKSLSLLDTKNKELRDIETFDF